MVRAFLSLAVVLFMFAGCTNKSTDNEGKTTADKGNSSTKTAMGTVVKRKTSGELCEGDNCPGYIK
ncbi:hypothetical protein KKF84_13575 [Myxococcota bacterium]|nr:hypothetical protein [Myxococcota bacterium]